MSNITTLDEVEKATASIQDEENQDVHKEVLLSITDENCVEEQETSIYTPLVSSPQQRVSLDQSAEEILSGIKKNVEVQYLTPLTETTSPKETGTHIQMQTSARMSCTATSGNM